MSDAGPAGIRRRLEALTDDPRFRNTIVALIAVNAVTLGLETSVTVGTRAAHAMINPHMSNPIGERQCSTQR